MSVNRDTVRYIANLARIEIEEEELEYLSSQLAKILNYIEKINELNLEEVPPALSPHREKNVTGEDRVKRFDNIKGIIELFPFKEDRFLKVPKVIEG